MSDSIAGYALCVGDGCGAMVLNEVAYKTNGHCAECFRNNANEILDAALVVVSGRERITLRTVGGKTRSPGDRAQRRRGKRRAAKTPRGMERARLYQMARARADARLRALFPELWEIVLADERAKLGLDAFTIDRCLRGDPLQPALDWLMDYRRLHADGSKAAEDPGLQPGDGRVPLENSTE